MYFLYTKRDEIWEPLKYISIKITQIVPRDSLIAFFLFFFWGLLPFNEVRPIHRVKASQKWKMLNIQVTHVGLGAFRALISSSNSL